MAEVKELVIKKEYHGKTLSISEFRMQHGITPQAVNYAIEHNLIDYVYISQRVRFIVETEKTLNYKPNKSPKRCID